MFPPAAACLGNQAATHAQVRVSRASHTPRYIIHPRITPHGPLHFPGVDPRKKFPSPTKIFPTCSASISSSGNSCFIAASSNAKDGIRSLALEEETRIPGGRDAGGAGGTHSFFPGGNQVSTCFFIILLVIKQASEAQALYSTF